MTKITYKMEETDPWYEDKIVQLEALENQLKKLYTLTEAVTCTRRELAIATGQFAVATSQLSITEDSNNLSKALSSLAKVEEKVEKVQHKQADADYVHLFELIKDYVALMSAVKDALTERQKAFQVCFFSANQKAALLTCTRAQFYLQFFSQSECSIVDPHERSVLFTILNQSELSIVDLRVLAQFCLQF